MRPPGAALPRLRLDTWLAEPRPRVYLLVAGAGAGKTYAAQAIADACGSPACWLDAAAWDGELPADPDAPLVLDGADQLARPEALKRLLAADRGGPVIVTSRTPPGVPLARGIATGRIRVLGPADLWLTPDEVALWAGAHADAAAPFAGWPLGVHAVAAAPLAAGLLADLVAEEWLDALPAEVRAVALAHVLGDPPAGHAPLRAWGLAWPNTNGADRWHPLAHAALLAAWTAEVPLADRVAQARAAGKAALLVGAVDRLAALLAHFDPRTVDAEPALGLLAGAVDQARGAYPQAEARFLAAFATCEARGDLAMAFEAQGDRVHLAWMTEDLPRMAAATAAAQALEPHGALGEQVEFWNNAACARFGAGDEAAAEAGWRRALDVPHLDEPQIASVQQFAALNLGILAKERGAFDEALRRFRHVLALAERFPLKPSIPRGAHTYIVAVATAQGDRPLAASHLQALEALPLPAEDRYRRAEFAQVAGDYHMLVGDFDAAEAQYREALALFAAMQMETNADAGLATHQLAILHRRRGALAAAERLHAEAAAWVAPWPRTAAEVGLEWAVTRLAAGDLAGAGQQLDLVTTCLATVPAQHLQAGLGLVRAVWHARSGDQAQAATALKPALAAIAAGPWYYAPIARRPIAPDLWALMAAHGHEALLRAIEERFPQAAAAIRAEQAPNPAPLPAAPAALLTLTCFGDLVVAVGGEPVTAWPRKKARALLAFLVLHPAGLARDDLAEQLFPDLGFEEGRHQIDVMLSALRKSLEPDLGRRGTSRYLEVKDKRLRLLREAVTTDVDAFEAAQRAGDAAWRAGDRPAAVAAYEQAAALYRGDLFAEPFFAEFFDVPRHRFRTLATTVFARLGEAAIAAGHDEQSERALHRWLDLEPANEAPHCELMRLYARFGRPHLVKRQYDLLAGVLRKELDDEPSAEARELYHSLVSN